jgi:hypothetical protein
VNARAVRYLSTAITTLVLASVIVLYGQTKPVLPETVTEEFAKANAAIETAVISLAEAMPEDKYSFVPTNGQYKGVRSFAQLVKHVAVDNYVDAAALLREKPPIDVGEHENGPDSIKSKAQILQFVRDSFAYMQKAIRTVNQDNLMEPIQFPAGASDTIPRLRIVDAAMAHPWDIYGQMIEYLRMTGIDPQAKR